MAEMPSVGDVLMLSQLAWKIGQAFTACRDKAPVEFLEVESSINAFAKALKLLAESLFADAEEGLLDRAGQHTRNGVITILASCQRRVNDLDSLIDEYQVIRKRRTDGGFLIERSWSDLVLAQYNTMMWTFEGGNIQNLYLMLQMHTSAVTLTMQALQSKSLHGFESTISPVADSISNLNMSREVLAERIQETHRMLQDIARRACQLRDTPADIYRKSSSVGSRVSPEHIHDDRPYETLRSGECSRDSSLGSSMLHAESATSMTQQTHSKTSSRASHLRLNKRVSDHSDAGSNMRYSKDYSSSGDVSTACPSPQLEHSNCRPSRRWSDSKLHSMTNEEQETKSRLDSPVLPVLPPPSTDIADDRTTPPAAPSTLSLHPTSSPEITRFHRSSTTLSQKLQFMQKAFKNSAILCDVIGTVVEYAQKASSDQDSQEVKMVQVCQDCRIEIVRQREPSRDSRTEISTSIWVFSEDNTVRLQLKMDDKQMYVPYSSYFTSEKISITVPCELKFHNLHYGERLEKVTKTSWINYVFKDARSATLFQNELMGRRLLGTFQTAKTMRIHEGLSAPFAYAEQMCAMENLRIWQDEETGAIIAMIHFSAQFRDGYLAFYLNDSRTQIRVKSVDGGKEVKIRGLRVPLEKDRRRGRGTRKDSGASGHRDKGEDKKKWIMGAKIEFANLAGKREFLKLVENVQSRLVELPELLGVN